MEEMWRAVNQQHEAAEAAHGGRVASDEQQNPPFPEGHTECPVCMEPSDSRCAWPAGCGHVFCEECATSCLRRSLMCPMCRAEAPEQSRPGPSQRVRVLTQLQLFRLEEMERLRQVWRCLLGEADAVIWRSLTSTAGTFPAGAPEPDPAAATAAAAHVGWAQAARSECVGGFGARRRGLKREGHPDTTLNLLARGWPSCDFYSDSYTRARTLRALE
jgi:hypothetical protein